MLRIKCIHRHYMGQTDARNKDEKGANPKGIVV